MAPKAPLRIALGRTFVALAKASTPATTLQVKAVPALEAGRSLVEDATTCRKATKAAAAVEEAVVVVAKAKALITT